MPLTELWRVKGWKLIDHWDEIYLLEVYLASLLMLIPFVIFYNLSSKPINRIQTEAAKTGERLGNGRELQAPWDRVLMVRVPLLFVSLLAQCVALLVASA